MTCIVAVETPRRAYIGADAFVGSASYSDVRAGSKLFARNGWHVGVAGSSRLSNVLEHVFEWPAAPSSEDLAAVVRVASDIAKLVADDDMCFSNEGGQRSLSSEVMLAAAGRVYVLGVNLGAYRSRRGYAAIGSGDQYALGALYATKDMPPRARVLVALRASAGSGQF